MDVTALEHLRAPSWVGLGASYGERNTPCATRRNANVHHRHHLGAPSQPLALRPARTFATTPPTSDLTARSEAVVMGKLVQLEVNSTSFLKF